LDIVRFSQSTTHTRKYGHEIEYVECWGLYWAGLVITDLKEMSRYKLDLVGIQEVRWDRGGTKSTGKYTFFYGRGNENHELGFFFVHERTMSS
jgi:hypothetical protein